MTVATITCVECGDEFDVDYSNAPEMLGDPKWCSEECHKKSKGV